mgnify:CR=1 FL=1
MALQVGDLNRDPKEGGIDPLSVGVGVGLALGGGALGLKYRKQLGLDRNIPKAKKESKGIQLDNLNTVRNVGRKQEVPESKVVVPAPETPQRVSSFPGKATPGSGFKNFSQQADRLRLDVGRIDSLLKSLEPDVAREYSQMMATEASRQAASVRRQKGQIVDDLIKEIRAEPQSFLKDKVQEVGITSQEASPAPERISLNTLTNQYEAQGEPRAAMQAADAVQSASDQLDSRAEAVVQRDTDSVRLGKQPVFTEKQQRIFRETAPRTKLDSPEAKLKRAAYQFEQMDMSGGLPDDQITAVGQAMAEARYDPTPSAYDLTGKIEDLPGVREMSAKRRKEVFGSKRLPPRGAFSDSDLSGINQEEAAERIMAAASQKAGSLDEQLLLDPSTPYQQLRQRGLLGSVPKFDPSTGYVETNPTMEIRPGASASMSDRPGKARIGIDTEFETNLGTEGSAYLKETLANKERTNKASTLLAGRVAELQGRASGSGRQERVVDGLVPIRTFEGEETAGVFTDPSGKVRLVGEGQRQRGKIESTDMSATGTRQPGGFEEPSRKEISPLITTAPMARKATNEDRLITDKFGRQFVIQSKSVVEGAQPLMGVKGVIKTPRVGGKPGTGVMSFKSDAKSEPLSINRQMAEGLAQDAADTYVNNPSAKLKFLQERNPNALKGVEFLEDAGNALDYKDFIIESVDKGLKQKGIQLDVLQPEKTSSGSFNTAAAHAFVDDLLKVSKDVPVYASPLKVDPDTGNPVLDFKGRVQGEGEAKLMPGLSKGVRGTGGVDPMQIGDDYEGNVAYNTIRVEGGRTLTPEEARPQPSPGTPETAALSSIREQMANVQPRTERFSVQPRDTVEVNDDAIQNFLAKQARRYGSSRRS